VQAMADELQESVQYHGPVFEPE